MKNDWDKKLKRADRHEREWRDRTKKILDRYRDEKAKRSTLPKMNLLWANTETLRPALYSQTPVPVVTRRFNADDPVSREASMVLEKAISFSVDNGLGDFDLFAQTVITDELIGGRSIDRVVYEPISGEVAGAYETVFERVCYRHVPWNLFRYDPQNRWEDVSWVAYGDHFYDWEELKEKFDLSEGQRWEIPKSKTATEEGEDDQYQCWEIWDRKAEMVHWYIEGMDDVLESAPPPVRLRGFFDCPDPLYSFRTNDSLVPIPEFTLYQYQADEVDRLTQRIQKITDAIRANGIYAGDAKNILEEVLTSDDCKMLNVSNWTSVTERGGIDGMIAWTPVEQYTKVLQILIAQRQQLIQQIFELTGISDIMRGGTDPRETARAQQIKANFGSKRLVPRQREVQRYFRDLFRIAGEIVSENFSRSTLQDIVGKPISDEAIRIIRDDAYRAFRVDIETDSTIAPDEMQQKQELAEFVRSLAEFLPVAQQLAAAGGPQVAGSIVLWAMRRFRAGREVEESLESFLRNPPPPQPDPEQQKMQAEMQMKEREAQLRQQEQQIEVEKEQRLAQIEIQKAVQEMRLDVQRFMAEMRQSQQMHDQQMQQAREMQQQKLVQMEQQQRMKANGR